MHLVPRSSCNALFFSELFWAAISSGDSQALPPLSAALTRSDDDSIEGVDLLPPPLMPTLSLSPPPSLTLPLPLSPQELQHPMPRCNAFS
jgi:hypothetical protein